MKIPHPLAVPALLLAASCAGNAGALAGQPYTVSQDVRVRIDARLHLMGFGRERPAHRALLEAQQPEKLGFSHGFELGEGRLEVEVVLTPAVDLADEICHLAVDVRVNPPGAEATRVTQSISTGPERVRLLELWSGERMDERLVLALTTTWETIPRVSLLRPGAEPVAILLELVEGERVLQRHELSAVVGESASFMVRHAPSSAARVERGEATTVSAELEFLPKSIEAGEVDLSVTLVVRREGTAGEPYRLDLRERLAPGLSLVLPVPVEAGGGSGTRVRVTPWF